MLEFYVPEVTRVEQVESGDKEKLDKINQEAFDSIEQKLNAEKNESNPNSSNVSSWGEWDTVFVCSKLFKKNKDFVYACFVVNINY